MNKNYTWFRIREFFRIAKYVIRYTLKYPRAYKLSEKQQFLKTWWSIWLDEEGHAKYYYKINNK
jgi:hypothetical protein